MPELPEVQTTVSGLNDFIRGLSITDIWTEYNSPYFHGGDTVKDPQYFKYFKKKVIELFKKHNIGNGEDWAFLEGFVQGS